MRVSSGGTMAAEITLLKGTGNGKVDESERQELSIEKMLVGFLRSLLDEQKIAPPAPHDKAQSEVGSLA
jgi:hypothetical protein